MKTVLQNIYDAVLKEQSSLVKFTNILEVDTRTSGSQAVVFLTISNNLSRPYVVTGKGQTFKSAIIAAIETYIKNRLPKYKPFSIKLDLLTEISPVNNNDTDFNIAEDKVSYNRGLDGFSFDSTVDIAFLPDEVVAYGLIKQKSFNYKNVLKALDNHLTSDESQSAESLNDSDKVNLYKFRTKSYYVDSNHFYELYRGHQIFTNLTKQDLWQSIELIKYNYFKNVVGSKGKFIYSYLPHKDLIQKKYNILRHAGTIYSMLETYELMPDKDLLKSIEKALSFLIDKLKVIEIKEREVQVVVEKDSYKIGGNALAIIALAKYTKITGSKQYIPIMQSLASWIQEVQIEDGQFSVHKQIYSTGEIVDFTSHFYPGEAILSLVRLYHLDYNESWLDVAEKAADYLINIRDKKATIDTIAHDHWLLYALNELYRVRKKDIYLKHSFFISESIMKTQIKNDDAQLELVGGYTSKSGKDPHSTPTACRSEGLSATYNLAFDFGYEKKAKEIKTAIQNGVQFQLQMQLRPESVIYYEKKKLCIGAIQGGLKKYDLRIDYTQHNISSFIAYYYILNEKT